MVWTLPLRIGVGSVDAVQPQIRKEEALRDKELLEPSEASYLYQEMRGFSMYHLYALYRLLLALR